MKRFLKIYLYFICLSAFSTSFVGYAQQTSSNAFIEQDGFKYKIIIDQNDNLKSDRILMDNGNDFTNQEDKLRYHANQKFWCLINIDSLLADEVFIINCHNAIGFKLFTVENGGKSIFDNSLERPYLMHNGQFIFELSKNTKQVLVKIQSSEYIDFNIQKGSKPLFFKIFRYYSIYYGIFLGILVLLFLYHSIIYFIVREKLYGIYIVQLIFSIVFILLCFGFDKLSMHHILIKLAYIALQICFVLIFLTFGHIHDFNKKIHHGFLIAIAVLLLTSIINIVFPSFYLKLILLAFAICLQVSFIFVFLFFRKKEQKPVLFLSALITLFVGQFLTFFQFLTKNETSFLYNHTFEAGLLLYNVLLALYLGNRLSIYKNEKSQSEMLEINALKEKEMVIQQQNQILETLITERNKELIHKIEISEKQKKEIESQNDILNNRISEIERMNANLVLKNQEISDQNIELEKHYKILEKTVKQRTKKLEKARKKAIIANKLKTSFLNNLTQEINIPMNAITGYSGMITDKDLDKETRNEYLHKINKHVDILLDSVDNIITLSRIQAGIVKPKFTEIGFVQFLDILKEHLIEKSTMSGKKVNFNFLYHFPDISFMIRSDYNKIIQIFTILLDIIFKQIVEDKIDIGFDIQIKQNEQGNKKGKVKFFLVISEVKHISGKMKEIIENSSGLKYDDPFELGINIIGGLIKILKGKYEIKMKSETSIEIKLSIPISILPAN